MYPLTQAMHYHTKVNVTQKKKYRTHHWLNLIHGGSRRFKHCSVAQHRNAARLPRANITETHSFHEQQRGQKDGGHVRKGFGSDEAIRAASLTDQLQRQRTDDHGDTPQTDDLE